MIFLVPKAEIQPLNLIANAFLRLLIPECLSRTLNARVLIKIVIALLASVCRRIPKNVSNTALTTVKII